MHPEFLFELKKRFTGDLRLDSASKVLYSTDASMYQIEPLGVAIPKHQEDLISAVELAVKYKIPILPRGAGSSLGGQAIGEALILDCSRYLDSIVEIDPESHTAIVEPGVVLADLNRAAAKRGLMYGPDPASAERATMGGVIGNNATGAHSILYGMSADHLIAADVILGDGTLETWNESGRSKISQVIAEIRERHSEAIKQNFPRSWRNSAGYRLNYLLPWTPSVPPQWDADNYGLTSSIYSQQTSVNMAALLAGSEGTLAVIRRAKVNLVPKPKHTILGVLAYDSIVEACNAVPRLLELKPSAIELIPRLIIQLARGVPAYARQMGWMTGDPAAVLVVEFSGDQPSALKESVRRLADVVTIAESPEEQSRVWNVRKMGLGILDSRQQSARPAAFIEDCAVPVERLGEFVGEVERIMREHQTEGGIYAHASAGCLHIRPILDLQKGAGVRALRTIGEQVLRLTLSLGGSMSSEHGDGIVSGEAIEKTYGTQLTDAMRSLKRATDPDNILNPKKMFDAPPMDSHLRYGADYQIKVWDSGLHFEHERGLAGAIEHCNGQGVCRKTTGVMCPSFQATRDEAFSTRGRSNLLRSLIARSNSKVSMDEVFPSLDLCLACKGCTSECPSGVDMPKLKYEFMYEYFKTHRRPLRDYLFGYFHVVAKWITPVAPLVNYFMRADWSRTLIARSAGITEKREFPVFAKSKLTDKSADHVAGNKTVLFLSDVFSKYLEPEVGRAAIDILQVFGFSVKILRTVGAGASLLSKGFIPVARSHARKLLDEIKQLGVGADVSVVGCEPPEVYCLKHEYSSLIPDRRDELELLAKDAWLVEEFLLRVANKYQDILQSNLFSKKETKLALHTHCHQQAERPADDGLPTGTAATAALLRMFGFEVEVIDAGCCGMAGTFGYDAEHYDLSVQVGELGVLPKVRKATAENRKVLSTGSACRLQFSHGAKTTSEHPLVLLARVINSKEEK